MLTEREVVEFNLLVKARDAARAVVVGQKDRDPESNITASVLDACADAAVRAVLSEHPVVVHATDGHDLDREFEIKTIIERYCWVEKLLLDTGKEELDSQPATVDKKWIGTMAADLAKVLAAVPVVEAGAAVAASVSALRSEAASVAVSVEALRAERDGLLAKCSEFAKARQAAQAEVERLKAAGSRDRLELAPGEARAAAEDLVGKVLGRTELMPGNWDRLVSAIAEKFVSSRAEILEGDIVEIAQWNSESALNRDYSLSRTWTPAMHLVLKLRKDYLALVAEHNKVFAQQGQMLRDQKEAQAALERLGLACNSLVEKNTALEDQFASIPSFVADCPASYKKSLARVEGPAPLVGISPVSDVVREHAHACVNPWRISPQKTADEMRRIIPEAILRDVVLELCGELGHELPLRLFPEFTYPEFVGKEAPPVVPPAKPAATPSGLEGLWPRDPQPPLKKERVRDPIIGALSSTIISMSADMREMRKPWWLKACEALARRWEGRGGVPVSTPTVIAEARRSRHTHPDGCLGGVCLNDAHKSQSQLDGEAVERGEQPACMREEISGESVDGKPVEKNGRGESR